MCLVCKCWPSMCPVLRRKSSQVGKFFQGSSSYDNSSVPNQGIPRNGNKNKQVFNLSSLLWFLLPNGSSRPLPNSSNGRYRENILRNWRTLFLGTTLICLITVPLLLLDQDPVRVRHPFY
jgi:hypothetical protein